MAEGAVVDRTPLPPPPGPREYREEKLELRAWGRGGHGGHHLASYSLTYERTAVYFTRGGSCEPLTLLF